MKIEKFYVLILVKEWEGIVPEKRPYIPSPSMFYTIRLPTKNSTGLKIWNTASWKSFETGIFKPDKTDLEFKTSFAGCGSME